MNIPKYTIAPFEPYGMPRMFLEPQYLASYILKTLKDERDRLQDIMNVQGAHAFEFDLTRMPEVAIEAGALSAWIDTVNVGAIKVAFIVPKSAQQFSRWFYFSIPGIPETRKRVMWT